MLEHIESMFADFEFMIEMKAKRQEPLFKKSGKKEIYVINMKSFREKNGNYFTEMMEKLADAEDKASEAQKISECIVKAVSEKYINFDRFRRRRRITDLNIFMIYYVFPAIQLTLNENAILLCDTLRDTWNQSLGEKIEYTDYNDIRNTFNDKIFGIM